MLTLTLTLTRCCKASSKEGLFLWRAAFSPLQWGATRCLATSGLAAMAVVGTAYVYGCPVHTQ